MSLLSVGVLQAGYGEVRIIDSLSCGAERSDIMLKARTQWRAPPVEMRDWFRRCSFGVHSGGRPSKRGMALRQVSKAREQVNRLPRKTGDFLWHSDRARTHPKWRVSMHELSLECCVAQGPLRDGGCSELSNCFDGLINGLLKDAKA